MWRAKRMRMGICQGKGGAGRGGGVSGGLELRLGQKERVYVYERERERAGGGGWREAGERLEREERLTAHEDLFLIFVMSHWQHKYFSHSLKGKAVISLVHFMS